MIIDGHDILAENRQIAKLAEKDPNKNEADAFFTAWYGEDVKFESDKKQKDGKKVDEVKDHAFEDGDLVVYKKKDMQGTQRKVFTAKFQKYLDEENRLAEIEYYPLDQEGSESYNTNQTTAIVRTCDLVCWVIHSFLN